MIYAINSRLNPWHSNALFRTQLRHNLAGLRVGPFVVVSIVWLVLCHYFDTCCGAMIPHESLAGSGRIAYPLSSFSFVNSRFVTVLQIFVTFGKLSLGAPWHYGRISSLAALTTPESKPKIYFCSLTKGNRQESAYKYCKIPLDILQKNQKRILI